MNKYKISIIVPVYNVEKYIRQCLDSIINQTYKNIEILLIDDGSVDNSGKICDEYAKNDKRIKVFHQKNSGVSRARNKGLDNITGDYVMFVDSDDWLELNACEILIKILKKHHVQFLIFNLYKEYNNRIVKMKEYNIPKSDNLLVKKIQAKILAPSIKIDDFSIGQIGFACTKIISSKLFKTNRFPFENKKAVYEDVLLYYNLFENVDKVLVCNEYLYHYRILNTSATRGYNADFPQISDEFNKQILLLKDKHKNDKYYFQSVYVRNLFNLTTVLNLFINNFDTRNSFKVRKKMLKEMLKKDYYKNSIANIKAYNLNKKLKIYYYLLKLKLYTFVILANDCEQVIKRNL